MRSRFLIFASLLFSYIQAQNRPDWVTDVIENFVNQNPDGLYDIQSLEEQINSIVENPVVLDLSNLAEIDRLFFLDPILIQAIKEHLIRNGNFISIYELQTIRGIDEGLARRLAYFVRIKTQNYEWKNSKFSGELKVGYQQGFLKSIGYLNQKYLGSPHRTFLSFKSKIGKNLQLGVFYDKDAGEMYWNRKYPLGFAHISAFVELNGFKTFKKVILGDYKLRLGQGLLIYQGYGFGKTIELIGNVKTQSGIQSNRSFSENFFLRGAAADIEIGKMTLIPFVSIKKLSATIYTDSSFYFKSIDYSGSLKTPQDIERNSNLIELLTGISAQYRNQKLRIGIQYLYSAYNKLYKNNVSPANVNLLSAKEFHHLSIDYKYHIKNGFLFGENAFQFGSNGIALLNGALFSISEQTSLLFSVRYFSAAYNSMYSSALSENSGVTNELGFLFNLQHQFSKRLSFQFYIDIFHFPWLKFNVDRPSYGFEVNSRLNYKLQKGTLFYFNFRLKSKEENGLQVNGVTVSLQRFFKYQFRAHFTTQISPKIDFSSRVELSVLDYQKTLTGVLWYLNIQFKINSKFTLMYRFNLFSTEDFSTAIYTLERSLGNVNGFAVFSGEGMSSYLFAKVSPVRNLKILLKVAFMNYFNQQSIGSGNDEIKKNINGYFGVELIWKMEK